MNKNTSANSVLNDINQWCANRARPDLAFSFTALPKPVRNHTYRLSKKAAKQFVNVTPKSNPLKGFTIAYGTDLAPTITLHTFKASLDGSQYVGSAIDEKAACESIYRDLADIEPPAVKGEKVLSDSNAIFHAIKSHLKEARNKAKKQLPNRYLANKGLSNSDCGFHFQGLRRWKNDVYRNGLYIPFFDINREVTAYQLIIDMYEVPKTKQRGKSIVETGGFDASEYTPTAKYVKSLKRFYTEFKDCKVGAYGEIGNEYDPRLGTLCLFEGTATGISVMQTRPAAFGVICGDAGSMQPVSNTLLEQAGAGWYEGLKLIEIFADNDIVSFNAQLANGNKNAYNAGLYNAMQTYLAHKSNKLGVEIVVYAVPDEIALDPAATNLVGESVTDFDDYRQYLSTVGKTLAEVLPLCKLDVTQLLQNYLNFCSEEKALKLNSEIVQAAVNLAKHRERLTAYCCEMGAFTDILEFDIKHLSQDVGGVDIPALLNFTGTTYLKSPMGTGKTVLIRLLSQLLQKLGKSLLYICPSIALTKQMCKKLRKKDGLNVIHYSEVGGRDLSQVPNFIGVTTINSVYHFGGVKFHTVVLDESEQLLPVIPSSIIKHQNSTMDYTREFCVNAQHVILCDAQMSKLTVDTMQRIKPGVENKLIFNKFQPAKDKKLNLFNSKGELWSQFEELLNLGKKIYLCSNSKTEALAFAEFVKIHYPTIDCLTFVRGEEDDGIQNEKLENIENEVLKHQVVISSPVVSSGVSIDIEYFDVVMGCFEPHGLGTTSLMTPVQQLGRVWKVKELYVYFGKRTCTKPVLDRAKLLKTKTKELQIVASLKQVKDAVTGEVKYETTYPDHVLIKFENLVKQNLLDTNQLESFTFHTRDMEGYQFNIIPENIELKKHGSDLRTLPRKIVEDRENNAVAAAKEIPIEQAAILERKSLKTKDNYNEKEKANACHFMGIEPRDFKAADAKLWGKGKLKKKVSRYELLSIGDEVLLNRDVKEYEAALENGTESTTLELLKWQKGILKTVHAAYFDEEGNHYEEVCNTSPSVVQAVKALLGEWDSLKLRGFNPGVLYKDPLAFINNQMRSMGFDFTSRQVRIDEDTRIRYYTASIDPDIAIVAARRELLKRGEKILIQNDFTKACDNGFPCGSSPVQFEPENTTFEKAVVEITKACDNGFPCGSSPVQVTTEKPTVKKTGIRIISTRDIVFPVKKEVNSRVADKEYCHEYEHDYCPDYLSDYIHDYCPDSYSDYEPDFCPDSGF